MPYRELQRLVDPLYPSGVCQYWKSSFLARVDDDALDTIVAHAAAISSPLTSVVIEQLGGAVARVGANETAFGHRDAAFDILITSLWTDLAESERHIRWTRDFWEAMQPFVSGGTYVNYLDADRPSDAAYDPSTYRRLVALKKTYDPTNFFRMNVNIQPTA
jgi:FAD/FMN-containing dehydrogenase